MAYENADERRPLLSQDEKADQSTILHESRVLLQYTMPLAAINFLRQAMFNGAERIDSDLC